MCEAAYKYNRKWDKDKGTFVDGLTGSGNAVHHNVKVGDTVVGHDPEHDLKHSFHGQHYKVEKVGRDSLHVSGGDNPDTQKMLRAKFNVMK